MNVLLLGSTGMAGHVILKYFLTQNIKVVTASRKNADIYVNVEESFNIDYSSFDYVINCVGLLVKDSIDNPVRARVINTLFPKSLEQKLINSNTRIVHLSTDCIFNGTKGPYIETDNSDEINAYGQSKRAGEINNYKDITFRSSIIGPELKQSGTGLFNFVQRTPIIHGWTNHLWNGITTLTLAKCIFRWMLYPHHTGIYHLVNNAINISKYELIYLINDVFAMKKIIIPIPTSTASNKILVNTQKIQYNISSYRDQLTELKNFYYT